MRWRTVVIILVLALLYVVLGGVFFYLIESGHEAEIKGPTYKRLQQFMSDRPCLNLSTIRSISTILGRLNSAGLVAIEGKKNLTYLTNWDLTSSIFLSFQVIGSVGFGNAAPRTTGGRVFCMFFAFIGIPLLLTAALGIAYMMVGGAERLRKFCVRKPGPKDVAKFTVLRTVVIFVLIFVLMVVIPAGILTSLEKSWSYGDAIYFCLTSVLSIGFSDFLPGAEWSTDMRNMYRLGVGFWLIISLLLFAALWNTVGMAIGSTKEMDEPLPGDFDGFLPPDELPEPANRLQEKFPGTNIAYITRDEGPSKIFAETVPTVYNNSSNPYVINRGPLYNLPVPRGELTQVAVRY